MNYLLNKYQSLIILVNQFCFRNIKRENDNMQVIYNLRKKKFSEK